jgi:hypothetical protein
MWCWSMGKIAAQGDVREVHGIALAVGVKEDKGCVGCRVGTKGASPNP